jgi:Tol biopolymer transport system component
MSRIHLAAIVLLLQLPEASLLARAEDLAPGETRLASRGPTGAYADDDAYSSTISGNGRYVAFRSRAANLVLDDPDAHADVFLHDLVKGSTILVSRGLSGEPGDGDSDAPAISKNGRFLAFQSKATDLVAADTNGVADVFVHDKKNGTTRRVSVGEDGVQANAASHSARISADGRFVAFVSGATNLVAGDTNAKPDVFVHDLQSGVTERVSVGFGAAQSNGTSASPALSANGRYVAFWSNATNLDLSTTSGVFVRDRKKGTTTRVSITVSGFAHALTYPDVVTISANGKLVTFAAAGAGTTFDDTSPHWDVFVRDVAAGTTELASPTESDGGANADCISHSISGNGRYVFFFTTATNVVASDTSAIGDVFVRDLKKQVTRRVTFDAAGDAANQSAYLGNASHDGRVVTFDSGATDLRPTPTSGVQVFARRW